MRKRRGRDICITLYDDRRSNVAVAFALSSLALGGAIGGGIDVVRAYMARQRLATNAALICQYANRPSITQYLTSADATAYVSKVAGFETSTLAARSGGYTQTNPNPFAYTAGSTTATVSLTSNVPTTLAALLGFSTIAVAATEQCPITNLGKPS